MKKNVLKSIQFTILAGVLAFVACDKTDTTTPPEIKNIAATNHDDNTTVIPRGGTISVNFEAVAKNDGKLDWYHIEIHDHPESGLVEDEYRIIDDSFMDKVTFKGLKNANVHEHIIVPAEANLGAYHVVITVVDEYGNSVDTEDVDVSISIIE
jgi:hypothetical protein